MKRTGPGNILISEPCAWDMDALGLPYLPYMWGVLKTYHEHHGRCAGDWHWRSPIFRYISALETLDAALETPIDVLGLSCYTWNWKLQQAIAARVKARYPDCLVVAGGPQPDVRRGGFFQRHGDIDAVAVKDGEATFSKILDALQDGGTNLREIPGLVLPDDETPGGYLDTGPADLPTVFEVSPYVTQDAEYQRLIAACDGRFGATWETQRGCPYRCSFCDWGSNTMSKVRRFAPSRIAADLDWLTDHGVSVLFLADANFGMFPEDVQWSREVTRRFQERGHPTTFNYNSAKNCPERSVAISKILAASGMPYKHTLSIQHTRPEVLEATERKNISSAKQVQVVQQLLAEGIAAEVQLISGIPGDTYALWQGCFGDLMEWGIDGQYQTYLYHLLPNAPAASAEFRRRRQLDTIQRRVSVSPHLGRIVDPDAMVETCEIVVGSSTYDRQDWVRMNAFSAFVKALHTTGMTQRVARYLRHAHGVSYEDLYRDVVDGWAVFAPEYRRVTEHYQRFLDVDGSEFMDVPDLPSYPYPVAPFQWVFIQICRSLDRWFESLGDHLQQRYPGVEGLDSLLSYQKELIILPTYDARRGKTFRSDRDWSSTFRRLRSGGEAPVLSQRSAGQVRCTDVEGSDGTQPYALDWWDVEPSLRWARWIERVVLGDSCARRCTFHRVVWQAAAVSPVAASPVAVSPVAGPPATARTSKVRPSALEATTPGR